MKAVVPYILVALLAAAVVLLLMRGCSKTTPLQPGKTAVDSASKADTAYHIGLQTTIDRLVSDSIAMRDSIDNQARQLAWYDVTLSADDDQITETMRALDTAKAHHNTVEIVAVCDSLQGEVISARKDVILYKGSADSLINLLHEQGAIMDSVADTWHSAYLHADSLNVFYKGQYDTLYASYAKQGTKLKRSSFIGKVLGGAAGALLLVLILK